MTDHPDRARKLIIDRFQGGEPRSDSFSGHVPFEHPFQGYDGFLCGKGGSGGATGNHVDFNSSVDTVWQAAGVGGAVRHLSGDEHPAVALDRVAEGGHGLGSTLNHMEQHRGIRHGISRH